MLAHLYQSINEKKFLFKTKSVSDSKSHFTHKEPRNNRCLAFDLVPTKNPKKVYMGN